MLTLARRVAPLPVVIYYDEQDGFMAGVLNFEPTPQDDWYYLPVVVDKLDFIAREIAIQK